MTKQDIIEYVMNTPHNTNKAVLSSMLNQLTDGGGDSGEDFSTAQVTLANDCYLKLPYCIDEPVQGIDVVNGGEGTYIAPLYKGHLYVEIGQTEHAVIGSAEIMTGGGVIDIYGDCTITNIS